MFSSPDQGGVNEMSKKHRKKRTPLRLCNGVLKPKGFGIQSWDWTIDADELSAFTVNNV